MRDLLQARESWPDLLVVAIDSNCRVFNACRSEVEDAVKDAPIPRILAIPDPHIERWLLLDSAAFKSALGKVRTDSASWSPEGHSSATTSPP